MRCSITQGIVNRQDKSVDHVALEPGDAFDYHRFMSRTRPSSSVAAFTLLELAMVLTIIGLVIGGVVAGSALIRGSQLQIVTTEYSKYNTAVQNFRDQYRSLPGDFSKANALWPTANNGNGNNTIGNAYGVGLPINPGSPAEAFGFWEQLALAKLIDGGFTGNSGPRIGAVGAIGDHVPGTNVPRSKTGAGWSVANYGDNSGGATAIFYPVNFENVFVFGGVNPGNVMNNAALTPPEAASIDTKLDDGLPGTGSVMALSPGGWYGAGNTNTCSLSLTNADTAKDYYNKANDSKLCALIFVRAF